MSDSNQPAASERPTGVNPPRPRRYQTWTAEEDEQLMVAYHEGMTFENLADVLGRSSGAIRSRLYHLGVLVPAARI